MENGYLFPNNLSKKRFWNVNKFNSAYYVDYYFTYDLNKKEIGKYLNTWFEPEYKNLDSTISFGEEYITLKKFDRITSHHLYGRIYNPVSISVYYNFNKTHKKRAEYGMKVNIHSIDDSSFGIWFNTTKNISNFKLEELQEKRYLLMKYINSQKELNGENLLQYAISIGAEKDSIDYN